MTSSSSRPHRFVARALALTLAAAAPAAAGGQTSVRPGADTEASDPGDFQQEVDYRIEAALNEATAVLTGRARLRYVNRSPFTLDTLWLHQHLNAFRPNSAWARGDLASGDSTFQRLSRRDHAFERLGRVTVDGVPVTPVYPGAPDSTVVGLPLVAPLRTGGGVVVAMDWTARLATVPRRQGRRGRHYDWAHWYPRIAVVDAGGWQTNPLIRAGEFYGEFAAYDVTLDLAEDQVVGATGVPVSGDPGWSAAAAPGHGELWLRRDAFGVSPVDPLGLLTEEPGPGRKRVRFGAERVHHFGWSASPDYLYEGGAWGDSLVAVHVLYQPGDTAWDEGVVLRRTFEALDWLGELFGAPYPWPQLTNLHRIESGATEFPMLLMNGSPSQGLILHETAHQYAHGILANNEWREAWLDEGMASFLTNWYWEEHGMPDIWRDDLHTARQVERAAAAEAVSSHAAEFSSYTLYQRMSYTKASLVLRMLRELVGPDVFREGLRAYYGEHAFRHVDEEDLREAMAQASGEDLGWFFRQWLHTTDRLDYALGEVSTRPAPDGGWDTTAEVIRLGRAWMPVELQVGDTIRTLDARERRQVVTVRTADRPALVALDPRDVLLDLDPTNNRRAP